MSRPFLFRVIGILVTFVVAGHTNLLAQETAEIDTFSRKKIPVLVEPMQFSSDIPPGLTERIQLVAYTILEQHWHYEVINHSSAKNTGEIDPEYIFQLSLQPLIEDLSQNDIRDTNKVLVRTDYYLSEGIRLNLRVTDIVSGELKYSRDVESIKSARGRKYFNSQMMAFAYGATVNWNLGTTKYPFPNSPEEEASIIQEEKNKLLLKALDELPAIWRQTLVEIFPVPIHLGTIINGSSKKPKQVQIDAGEDFGIRKGYPLEVYTYKVYRALGEEFLREEKLSTFYPVDIGPDSTVGRLYGGRKEVGDALARGEQIFLRFKNNDR